MSWILKYFHVKQKQSSTTRAVSETNLPDLSGPLSKVILSSTILYTHDAHKSSNLQQLLPLRLHYGHSCIKIQASAKVITSYTNIMCSAIRYHYC